MTTTRTAGKTTHTTQTVDPLCVIGMSHCRRRSVGCQGLAPVLMRDGIDAHTSVVGMAIERDGRPPDVRIRTYLRCFGRTPEFRRWGPMALVISISFLIKKGPLEFLIVLACTYAIAVPIGFMRWRQLRLRGDYPDA